MKDGNSVFLLDDDHAYERVYVQAKLGEKGLEVWAMTSEKAPGDRYGKMYRVDRDELPKALGALGATEETLLETLKRRFSGDEAEKIFLAFCKENAIRYTSFLAH